MIREAGLIAMRDKRDTIIHKDLSEAYDRLLWVLSQTLNII